MKQTMDYIISRLSDILPLSEARETALWIMEESTGLSRTDLLSDCKDTKIIPNIEIILDRLHKNEPIQYIFNHTVWMGLDLFLSPDTLIPRPETAELVEWVCAVMPAGRPLRVLDIGTGSGCIAIALKQRRPNWQVSGLDVSEGALQIAGKNAVRNDVAIDWIKADILSDEIGTFDVIVSNPPYVCESEKQDMENKVLDYEPASALFVPDDNPLLFYRRIIGMKAAPIVFFEVNERFAEDVEKLMANAGYVSTEIKQDMYGKQRMVCGRIEK